MTQTMKVPTVVGDKRKPRIDRDTRPSRQFT
jgi:hypothetical protein